MKGTVFDIQRFCVHDGPGIRTTVFLKGCPMSCAWCHNPEGRSAEPALMFDADKCVVCGACAAVCTKQVHVISKDGHTINRTECVHCGACADACVYGTLELAGKEMEVREITDAVLRDRDFYKADGGVTFSGGEPLAQYRFVTECAKQLKEENISVCVETSGCVQYEALDYVRPYTDIFLYDVKETDAENHRKYTGRDNEIILQNLARLGKDGAKIILRCPIIPGVNDRDDHFEKIAELANTTQGVMEIDIEPYHPLGIDKAKKCGETLEYTNGEFLKQEDIQKQIDKMKTLTDIPVMIS